MKTGKLLTAALAAALALAGCRGPTHATRKAVTEGSGTASIVLTEERFAMVLPRSESTFDDLEVQGFSEIMEKAGRSYEIFRPSAENPTADQQKIVRSLIEEHVSAIAIAPTDAEALREDLRAAMEGGIDVCSFDKPASPESRELFVNATGNDQIAGTLLDAVLELTGGEGQWALLSESAISDSQNGWVGSMKDLLKQDSYEKLQLLEIAYGSDSRQSSYQQTRALLQNYPDLKAIVSTTTTGLAAAAEAVRDAESAVRVTGFGLPSEMAEFVSGDGICPCFFLRNPLDIGRMTAYVLIALRDNVMTGAVGETFRAGDLGEYTTTEASDNGTEVIIGAPYRVDSENIERWAKVF